MLLPSSNFCLFSFSLFHSLTSQLPFCLPFSSQFTFFSSIQNSTSLTFASPSLYFSLLSLLSSFISSYSLSHSVCYHPPCATSFFIPLLHLPSFSFYTFPFLLPLMSIITVVLCTSPAHHSSSFTSDLDLTFFLSETLKVITNSLFLFFSPGRLIRFSISSHPRPLLFPFSGLPYTDPPFIFHCLLPLFVVVFPFRLLLILLILLLYFSSSCCFIPLSFSSSLPASSSSSLSSASYSFFPAPICSLIYLANLLSLSFIIL